MPRSSLLRVIVFALAAAGGVRAVLTGSAQAPPPARTTVVLSDLHMGPGRTAAGEWHPYEDFRWPSELAAFLAAVNTEGRGATDLVLNGDTFELLQSATADCQGTAAAGCTEDEALARLERVLTAHAAELKSLAAFAQAGDNRIVIVPGDHDAALLLPAVGRRLASGLGAAAPRIRIATEGYWASGDGRLVAEHGHQIGSSPHRFDAWPSPSVAAAGTTRVTRPWGEQAVQGLYNRVETAYPIVDNVSQSGAGIKFALAADPALDVAAQAPELLHYFLLMTPWQQFRMELDGGEVQPPRWNLADTRAQGAAFLVSALPDDDPFKKVASEAQAQGRLAELAKALSDDEVLAICDYRAAVRRARRRFEPVVSQFAPRGPVITECLRMPDTRGAVFDYFWQSRDRVFGRYLETVAARQPGKAVPAVFVHGHTHLPDRAQSNANMISGGLLTIPMEGFSPVRGALTPVVINGGAWQRTITPVQLGRMQAERGVGMDVVLRETQPEQLPACYGFVLIPAYTDAPAPSVRYWRPAAGGSWSIAGGCGPS